MNELEKRKERLNREFDETLDHLRREKIWLTCAGRSGAAEVDEEWKEFDRRVERFKEVVRLRDHYERMTFIRKGQEAIDRANKHG
jgi:hypothetical protein